MAIKDMLPYCHLYKMISNGSSYVIPQNDPVANLLTDIKNSRHASLQDKWKLIGEFGVGEELLYFG